jgi:arylsulfatase A-like enzyme
MLRCPSISGSLQHSRHQAQVLWRRLHPVVSSLVILFCGDSSVEGQTVQKASEATATSHSRPNVLLILADDLGYSDLGCYGSEIETPNLDSLAANGLRFTSFYNTARCWPTRAALLTGYYPQQVRRDALPTVPGGVAPKFRRPKWAPLLPQMLKSAGYRSYYSGKWHIDGTPAEGGFDRSYELADQGRFFRPTRHLEDGKPLPAIKDGDSYYSTIAVADHAIKVLKDHATSHSDAPFFQYVAFTAPHFPLQALPEDIAKYAKRYSDGWDKLREERWKKIQSLGLQSGHLSQVERQLGPPYAFSRDVEMLGPNEVTLPSVWTDLNAEQQQFQATKMAIHAAMVDRMDQEIGRILQQLRAMKAFENTLVLFLSDNGASAEMMVRDDGHDVKTPMGSAATHLCLGPGWSTVCNTPFRRHKTWVHEGGISTPLIAHWPAGISEKGDLQHVPGHVIDIVPTILDVAKTERAHASVEGDVPLDPGVSLSPFFSSKQKDSGASDQQPRALWWLHEGNRALRIGGWKIVATKGQPWELYNVSVDRAEQNDLSATEPAQLKMLEAEWNRMTEEFTALVKSVPEQ